MSCMTTMYRGEVNGVGKCCEMMLRLVQGITES